MIKKYNNIILICIAIVVVSVILTIVGLSNGWLSFKKSEAEIQTRELKGLVSKLDILEINQVKDNLSEDIHLALSSDSEKLNNLSTKTIQFVIDTSASMSTEKIEALKNALFELSAIIPEDAKIELITFDSNINVYKELGLFTEDTKITFANYVNILNSEDYSRTYDALMYAMGTNINTDNYNIILICDGPANLGYTYNDVKAKIPILGIPIYTVQYEQDTETEVLEEISNNSNAMSVSATTNDIYQKLKTILETI